MHLYVLGWIEFTSNVACNDGAFADILVTHEHNFEFLDGVPIRREADAITHNYQKIQNTNNQIIYNLIIKIIK
jgi:hypothetical protein